MGSTTVLKNGRIYPLSGFVTRAEAAVLTDSKIGRLGSNEAVSQQVSQPDHVIDLQGRAVLPVFSDCLARLGQELRLGSWLDLSNQNSIPEIFSQVEKTIQQAEPDSWVVGQGWNRSQWGWVRFPHRADLDLVAPHHRVVLISDDNQVAWLNSAAVQSIGLNRDTPTPAGGEIERDAVTQSATGILKQQALQLVYQALPAPESAARAEALRSTLKQYFERGVGLIESFETAETALWLQAANSDDLLPVPIVVHLHFSDRELLLDEQWRRAFEQGQLRLGGVWLQSDGSLSSQCALMATPYQDDWGKFGLEVATPQEVEALVDWCAENKVPPICQASGDKACQHYLQTLWKYADRLRQNPVLAHGDCIPPADVETVSRLGLRYYTNPRRIEADCELGAHFLGDRWQQSYPLQRLQLNGVQLRWGSAEPLARWSPLRAIRSAVSAVAGRPSEQVLSMEEAVTVACRGFEAAVGDAGAKTGFLSVGQKADLVVLSDDPFTVSPEGLRDIRVDILIVNGEVVFDRSLEEPQEEEATAEI